MKAAPAPSVSGRYFLPNAPLLCLKRSPAWAVTSVNSIGPEGRGGVGLGEGDTAAIGSLDGAVGATVAGCLQATKNTRQDKKKNDLGRILLNFVNLVYFPRLQPHLDQHRCWTNE